MFIKNRKNQKISVIVEQPESPRGLAFVMHGLGGFKEQPHIKMFAQTFLEHNITVVRFDAADTIGQSGGRYEDATITSYYQDLEDVIEWAKAQNWYSESFFLVGHSLGGTCVALYAQQYPDEVLGLAPIATVVSGKLSQEAPSHRGDEWKKSGWETRISKSKPGVKLRLPWSHMEDRLKYDLLKEVEKLTMPVLLIVGERDNSTPAIHQKILFDVLPGAKELHIIPGSGHSFQERQHLDHVKTYLSRWLKKQLN